MTEMISVLFTENELNQLALYLHERRDGINEFGGSGLRLAVSHVLSYSTLFKDAKKGSPAPSAGAAATTPAASPAEPLEGLDIGSDGLSEPAIVPKPVWEQWQYRFEQGYSLGHINSLGMKGWRLLPLQIEDGSYIFERRIR
jgi:hypothetical protein